jgi:hypothetical protein
VLLAIIANLASAEVRDDATQSVDLHPAKKDR